MDMASKFEFQNVTLITTSELFCNIYEILVMDVANRKAAFNH